MKILVDVVVTNMETGHVAVSQEQVELDIGKNEADPERHRLENTFYENLKKSGFFKPQKVGPLLIDRSFIALSV